MSRRLPSTSMMLALEAAARHQSFAKAAQELSLSEGAISRQISKLEEFLGTRLFNRIGNRVELSVAGDNYTSHIRTALADIERHTRQLVADARGSTSLEIGVIPTFASRWLIPRLPRFQARYPDIKVNLHERTQPFSLEHSGLHAAINYVHPAWQTMRVQPLFEEPMVAVCHPRLASELPESMPLLHKLASPYSWARYATLAELPLDSNSTGPTYDRYALLIEAAKAGIGMALVPNCYVEEELLGGRLVAPWPAFEELCKRYVLVTRPSTHAASALTNFKRWLMEESASSRP
ncbi:LysR substrate-binding domain-containing protein [Pseudomonas stutzeri]|uniref:LysR family transcriptional regulator n=1 Tax=Stutzerimonas stutzeri TaxID=316 RepID=A0A2N8S813_STUST|nr:LysR substrate-binding domain-containing protein [Stutzerimonas stutzeri]MCQ4297707.1 LysR substrate-binding domain-containing protein [Stutzerimonas stutzeri]PNF82753.1 LysR family transcriptional regulator [Stutzerimonas stutzeri]